MVSIGGIEYSMNVPQVDVITFFVVTALLILLSVILAIIVGSTFYFGKAMRRFLTARLKHATGVLAIFENENLILHLANLSFGGVFKDTEDPKAKSVVPKSVVTINSVKTALVWNVTPELPEVYTAALEKLVGLGYNSEEEIVAALEEGKVRPADKLLEATPILLEIKRILTFRKTHTVGYNLTFEEFLTLHDRIKNKNTINVTVGDVLEFNKKFTDQHPIKSLVSKLVNIEKKKSRDKIYQKYAFIIIGAMVILGMITKLYQVVSGK